MNKVSQVTIEGKHYNTAMMTSQTLAEFVVDVNKVNDIKAVLHKYNIQEVK